MSDPSKPGQILIFCPMPYSGRGPPQSCVALMGRSGRFGLREELFVPRATKRITRDVVITQTLPLPVRYLPWKMASSSSAAAMDKVFRAALGRGRSTPTIAWMWPTAPIELLRHAKSSGAVLVREMINCSRAAAIPILDAAYDELGLAPSHGISVESAQIEREELAEYDRVFASNSLVERSVAEAGVEVSRVIPTAFGWSPERYRFSDHAYRPGFKRALYVGTVNVGKGVPYLLKAWQKSGIDGELIIAGSVHPELTPFLEPYRSDPSIRFLDYVEDMSALYNTSDFLVFPSLAEGGPQVVYEAAGAGLPVITTETAKGRVIAHDVNGLIVPSANVDDLAAAMATLASSPDLRERLGRQGRIDAQRYIYDTIADQRAESFAALLRPSAI
jgi:glycosyltransferase involved in cell wall biosynthesis